MQQDRVLSSLQEESCQCIGVEDLVLYEPLSFLALQGL
jgi:hypothetical protein